MKKATLIKTNPYLSNRVNREWGIVRSVESSSAIEGIHGSFASGKSVVKNSRTATLKPQKSSGSGKKRK